MASTVTPSEFKVFIKEDHVINGIRTVNENLYRIPNVTNYDRRIVTVPADTNVDLINTNGLTPGPALFPSYSIAYGRITNMDDTNRLAVTFTSSNGESETGKVGADLSGSYTSGGIGGTAGKYSNLPTTSSISGSGMTLQVITDETLKSDPLITLTPVATTLAAIGTYNVALTGGTGTGATGSVTVTAGAGNDASIPTYTQLEFVTSGSGYTIGDQLVIPAGALSNGNLIKGNTLTNVTIPTVDNDTTVNNIPIVTSTGQGATVNVNSSGNVINTVIVNAVGKEFQADQEFIIKEATLQSLGFGGASGDYKGRITAADLATSVSNTLPALVAGNLEVRPVEVTIQTGGSGYAVGEQITVNKANIGNSTADLVYTLDTNDFSLTGTKSYWTMECLPTSSIMFSSPNCSGSKFNGIFEQDIEFISVYALTGSVDVEYVLVNAPVATN
jgi:hypothetical protein|tara:strand:- start:123 stop:1457 length:1335 start_codon:yes stop_codon:yes gene_type:complete